MPSEIFARERCPDHKHTTLVFAGEILQGSLNTPASSHFCGLTCCYPQSTRLSDNVNFSLMTQIPVVCPPRPEKADLKGHSNHEEFRG